MTDKLQKIQIEKLDAERIHILQELQRLRATLMPETNPDVIDLAAELAARDVTLKTISVQEKKLLEIEAALQQIQRGGYGICVQCGKPIDPERLEILPETQYCTACKKIVERSISNA